MTSASYKDPERRDWAEDVLGFWFEELDAKAWFTKNAVVDISIRERFLGLHDRLLPVDTAALLADGRTALAAILVFDQFPRNMFRDTPKAFATDAKALTLAKASIDAGHDGTFEVVERVFLYLPFEHSESLADQDRAVALISALGDAEYTRYAEAHRDVIRRFGRFPHRNQILGRASTPEEAAYLAQPGSGF